MDDIENEGDNREYTAQVDYVQPVGKSKLEVGAKTVIREITSDSRFDPNVGLAGIPRSNIFNYDQDVYAGYASYNFNIGKFNLITGLRYERTSIAGDGSTQEQSINNKYDNWLPNFAISRALKNFRNLKFAYSQRIQRPSLYYINPFRNSADFANITQGNPKLDPELTYQYELSYNTNFAGFTIFGSTYYKRTTGLIEQFSFQEAVAGTTEDVQVNGFSNVGTNNSIGVNIFTSKSIGKFTIRGGGDIYTYNASGIVNGQALENKALSYRLFTNGDFAISGSIKMDFFGFFQAPQFTLQGENPSFSIIGVGLRKDFKDWSLGVRVIEPFAENKNFNSDIQGNGFRSRSTFSLPFRSIGLNLRYKFGKVDFKERKSKIKNTDQKGGGDQQGQGGQGGGIGG